MKRSVRSRSRWGLWRDSGCGWAAAGLRGPFHVKRFAWSDRCGAEPLGLGIADGIGATVPAKPCGAPRW